MTYVSVMPLHIALGCGLDDRGVRFSSPPWPDRLWGSPMLWVPGVISLGLKRLGREANHSPPSSAEVENAWSYTSTPPIRLHGVLLS
jgi:hypothetical protein